MVNSPAAGDRPHTESAAAVQLREAMERIASESSAVRMDMAGAERARKRFNAVFAAMLAVLVLLVAGLMAVSWQNNRLVHEVNRFSEAMADCTTPGGKCYQQGNDRYAQAIADVIRSQVYMAECARLYPNQSGPGYDQKLRQCVYARLALPPSSVLPSAAPKPAPSPSAGSR